MCVSVPIQRGIRRLCALSNKQVKPLHLPLALPMKNPSNSLAAITQPTPQTLALSCAWTARRIGEIGMPMAQFDAFSVPEKSELIDDGAGIEALDTAGAWVLNKLLHQLRSKGAGVQLQGLRRNRR